MTTHAHVPGTSPASARELPAIPRREAGGHKGTFGTVAVIGGCARSESRMIGAPALAAVAALRAGAGLARIVAPEPILNFVLALAPSATGRGLAVTSGAGGAGGDIIAHEAAAVIDEVAGSSDAVVIGPGLGASEGVRAAALRVVQLETVPVVVDADGLNALAATPEFSREVRARAILTPHPGEFKRLCEGLGLRNHLGIEAPGDGGRESACERLAQRLGCVVVLKGAGTVVSSGLETWTHKFADSVLACGGTGDVLAGLIGGLVAQFAQRPAATGAGGAVADVIAAMPGLPADVAERLKRAAGEPTGEGDTVSLFDAARLGVAVHAAAARAWRAAHHGAGAGMLAMELADFVPAAIEAARAKAAGGSAAP